MGARLGLTLWLLVIGGCVGGAGMSTQTRLSERRTRAASEAGGAPAGEDARPVDLYSRLPSRLSRCLIARPGRVPARRRALLIQVTDGDGTGYDTGLAVVEMAQALAVDDAGVMSRWFLRFSVDEPTARERLRALPIVWEGDTRAGRRGRARARWVGARTLEIARGSVVAPAVAIDRRRCIDLWKAHPGSVEVSVRLTGGSVEERVVTPTPRGVRIVTTVPAGRADRIEQLRSMVHGLRRVEVRRDQRAVRLVEVVDWQELEIEVRDERLRIEAMARAERRRTPIPIARVNLQRLDEVTHQIRLREAEARRGGDSAALLDLLTRAYPAHPEELWIARRLARALLGQGAAESTARALELADSILARPLLGAESEARWRQVRREALLSDLRQYSEAMVRDRITHTRREAARAREAIAQSIADGTSYPDAEAAWQASREASRSRPGGR